MLIVMLDKLVDLAFQIRYRVERAAADRLIGDQCKPAFDLVQPRAIRRREMQMKPLALGEPCAHPGVLVSSIVVADQMYIEVLWNVRLDVPQEAQKLLMPMLRLALRERAATAFSMESYIWDITPVPLTGKRRSKTVARKFQRLRQLTATCDICKVRYMYNQK